MEATRIDQTLLELLTAERIDENRFRGHAQHVVEVRLFGGLVAGQALTAAASTFPLGISPNSVHCCFIGAGDAREPVVYDVHPVRDTRATSLRQVTAEQNGRRIFFATVSGHMLEPGLEHQKPIPIVPGPQECESAYPVLASMSQATPEVYAERWTDLDIRYVAPAAGDGDAPAPTQWWHRSRQVLSSTPGLPEAMLAYMSDLTLLSTSLTPHGVSFSRPGLQSASLDHVMWVHREFRADEWLLFDQTTPSTSRARGLAMASVYAESGELVATIAQEGLIRVPGN